jgi:hypothetical protein
MHVTCNSTDWNVRTRKAQGGVESYLTKGVEQKIGVFYLIHLLEAGGEAIDGGKRVHPNRLGRGACENAAKCLCRP